MKKAFRHLLATLLALAMVCALAAPVFADTNNNSGSITITNAAWGETYNLYKLFTLDSYEGTHYSYSVVSDWKTFFETGAGNDYITLENGHPTWKGIDDAERRAELAAKAIAYATDNSITATATQKAADNPRREGTPASTTVTFTGLNLGYYLVDSSMGTLCALNTTNTHADITEKNGIPTVETVFVTDNGDEVKTIHTQTNQIVKSKTTITVAKGTLNYKLFLGGGVPANFTPDLKITVNGAEIHNYTNKTTSDPGSHEITFDNDYIKFLQPGTKIVVETSSRYAYHMGDDSPYPVSALLTYGAGGQQEDEMYYVTHGFDLIKYDGDTNNLITGAKFQLYDSAEGGSPIALHKNDDGSYSIPNGYGNDPSSTVIEVDAKKAIRICGLGGKKYYLEEIEAPAGYNTVQGRIEVDVAEKSIRLNNSAPANFTTYDESYGGIGVANKSGVVLPSTGGMGTTIFYVVGGLLMVGAAVLLVTKKRMQKN